MKRKDIGVSSEILFLLIAVCILIRLSDHIFLTTQPGHYSERSLNNHTEEKTIVEDSFPFGTKRPSSMTIFYMEGDKLYEDYTVDLFYDFAGRLSEGTYEYGVNIGRISYQYSGARLLRRKDSLIFSTDESCFQYGADGCIIRYLERFDNKKQLARGTVTEYFYDEKGVLNYAVCWTVPGTKKESQIMPHLILFNYGSKRKVPDHMIPSGKPSELFEIGELSVL